MNFHHNLLLEGGANTTPYFPSLAESVLVNHGGESQHELERKYLFPCDHAETDYKAKDAFVARLLLPHKPRFVAFSGIDYCCLVRKDGKTKLLRYRTGAPNHNLFCCKVKEEEHETLRSEIENQWRRPEDMPTQEADALLLSKAKALLDMEANFHGEAVRIDFRVAGNIRYVGVPGYKGKEIEVVVYTGLNLATRAMVSVAEIEAHRFNPHTERHLAERHIDEWQDRLGWGGFRTSKSMSELLSGDQ